MANNRDWHRDGRTFTEEELNPNRPHEYRKTHNGVSPIGNIHNTMEEIKKNDPERYQAILEKRKKTTEENKAMQKRAKEIMEMAFKLSPEEQNNFIEQLKTSGQMTVQDAVLYSAASKAIRDGDIQAATFVRDTSGNKPKEEVEHSMSIDEILKNGGVFDPEDDE